MACYLDKQRHDSPRHRLMFKLLERRRSRQPRHCSAYLLGIGFGPRKLHTRRKVSLQQGSGSQPRPRAMLSAERWRSFRSDGYIKPKICRRLRLRKRMERIRAAIRRMGR